MFRKLPALRQVSIYMLLSYIALITANNSGYELDNIRVICVPIFVDVYIFSRLFDTKLPAIKPINEKTNNNISSRIHYHL